MELTSKTAVVTGGAVRIGRAISVALAEEGCHVFIHYGASQEEAKDTLAMVESRGVRASLYQADLTNLPAVRTIIPSAVSQFGKVDVLVNNAAVFLPGGLMDTREEEWEEQLAINLRAPYFLCQDFARQISKDERGSIVNITDARIYKPAVDHGVYRLSKSALKTMTETLALDLAPNINVNALALGAMLPPHGKGQVDLEAHSKKYIPLGVPGSVEIVTENLIHVLKQDFLTGATIRIDGGEFL